MAAILSRVRHEALPKSNSAITEPRAVRWLLILVAVSFLGLFLLVPLVAVFYEALKQGTSLYLAAFEDKYALDAILLTAKVAAISVPLNLVFGLAAAWAITKIRQAKDAARRRNAPALAMKREHEAAIAALKDGKSDVILATRNGMAIRFHETDAREMGRATAGVKGSTGIDADGAKLGNETGQPICSQPNGDAAPPPPSVKETVEGEATFYADHFEGRRTASGIPFRQNQLVAAHRGFPFGTLLRVTNLRNGKAVNVRVVDRGLHGGVPSAVARQGAQRDVAGSAGQRAGVVHGYGLPFFRFGAGADFNVLNLGAASDGAGFG